jgi:hypothetical protein
MYQDYTVRITFLKEETGATEYILPYVFHVSDPKEGIKANVIQGNRGDGSIVIPGGKRSQEIRVRGKLFDNDGYKDLTTLINEMKSELTTDVATLTMEHKEGVSWVTDWQYTVRRINTIDFPESLRVGVQEYEATFLVIAY